MYLEGFGVVEYDQNMLQEIFKELIKYSLKRNSLFKQFQVMSS